jgi:hypothetical protein
MKAGSRKLAEVHVAAAAERVGELVQWDTSDHDWLVLLGHKEEVSEAASRFALQ